MPWICSTGDGHMALMTSLDKFLFCKSSENLKKVEKMSDGVKKWNSLLGNHKKHKKTCFK